MTDSRPDPAAALSAGRVTRGRLDELAHRIYAPRGGDARKTVSVMAPMTGESLADVPVCTPEDVRAAAARAREVQWAWALRDVRERAAVLHRFHDLVLSRQDELLDLIQLENGKARLHAFEEVGDAAIVARYYGNIAPRLLRPARRQGLFPLLTQTWEHHPPKGLAGFIVPWNYPLTLGISDTLPALVAGNGAVIKPDEHTPFTTLLAVELLEEAGLPHGLVQVVTGAGADLGPTLIESVDFLMFTGSTATGRIVAQQAAARLVDFSMELGGKNALLVLADADPKKAARGAVRAAFSNGGQLCVSMERAYVEAPIYDAFVTEFVAATKAIRLSAALSYDGDVGTLISAEHLAAVSAHVDEAVAMGATVLAGGKARPDIGPYFYEPTILADVTPEMTLCINETFGPVVAVYRVRDADEAIERANDSPYGLNFSVWTGNRRLGHDVAARLHAGTVNVNEGYAAAWGSVDAPMGGFKDSGVGRRHGEHGLLKYTEAQTIAIQRGLPVAPPPHVSQRAYAKAMTGSLRLLKRVPWVK